MLSRCTGQILKSRLLQLCDFENSNTFLHHQLVDRVYQALKERHNLEQGSVTGENADLTRQPDAGFAETEDGSLTILARNLQLSCDALNLMQNNGFSTATRVLNISAQAHSKL